MKIFSSILKRKKKNINRIFSMSFIWRQSSRKERSAWQFDRSSRLTHWTTSILAQQKCISQSFLLVSCRTSCMFSRWAYVFGVGSVKFIDLTTFFFVKKYVHSFRNAVLTRATIQHRIHHIEISKNSIEFKRNFTEKNPVTSRLFVSYSLAIAFSVFELVPVAIGITSISIFRSAFGKEKARNNENVDVKTDFLLKIYFHFSDCSSFLSNHWTDLFSSSTSMCSSYLAHLYSL